MFSVAGDLEVPKEIFIQCLDAVMAPHSISACEERNLLQIPREELCGLAGKVSNLALTCTTFYKISCGPLSIMQRIYTSEHSKILAAISVKGNERYTREWQKVIDVFGGIEQLYRYPILDIGEQNGLTDYIDFIQPALFPDKTSIVMGIDLKKRLFFSLLVSEKAKEDTHFAVTFFQRHFQQSSWGCAPDVHGLCPMYNGWGDVTLVLQGEHPKYQLHPKPPAGTP